MLMNDYIENIKFPKIAKPKKSANEDFIMVQVRKLGKIINKKSGLIVQDNVIEKLYSIFENSSNPQELKEFVAMFESFDSDSSEFLSILDNVLNNETFFFRHPSQFEFLENSLLPRVYEAVNDRDKLGKINVLSAGCSYGSEAYSLAICLFRFVCKQFEVNYKRLLNNIDNPKYTDDLFKVINKIDVRGYDISSIHVRTAGEGIFRILSSKSTTRDKFDDFNLFLHPVDDKKLLKKEHLIHDYAVHDILKKMTHFQRFNLRDNITSSYKFDVIFCRNMLMYNDEQSREAIVRNLISLLNNNGFIVFAPSDFPPENTLENMHSVNFNVYQKVDD